MPIHPTIRARARSAFTMVELMVVVMILGMMAYTIGISFEAILPGERLNKTVRALSGVLQTTRSDAIARNAEFWIEYDLLHERYRVHTPFRRSGGTMIQSGEEIDPEERFTLPWESLEEGIDLVRVEIAGEIYTDASVMVHFDPLGAVSGHTVTITQPAYDNTYTIEVLPLTGLVRLHYEDFRREPPEDGDFN